jgi:hypothetical protein
MDEQIIEWRNAEWEVKAGPDGRIAADDVRLAVLMDIRGLLRKIKSILVFFTVLTVIGLLLGLLVAAVRH